MLAMNDDAHPCDCRFFTETAPGDAASRVLVPITGGAGPADVLGRDLHPVMAEVLAPMMSP